jgi:hypothetical protein
VEDGSIPPGSNIIHLDDDVTIENYYCYEGNDELVKITKIRASNETVTLTDRITIYSASGRDGKKEGKKMIVANNSSSTP